MKENIKWKQKSAILCPIMMTIIRLEQEEQEKVKGI